MHDARLFVWSVRTKKSLGWTMKRRGACAYNNAGRRAIGWRCACAAQPSQPRWMWMTARKRCPSHPVACLRLAGMYEATRKPR